jgi:6-carboxyhexanoate--CoA ligase
MHGAALVLSESAVRVEPDRQRGVRVSRLGILREAERRLSRRLARKGINTITVKEALVLASKVASCGDVLAELCVSDDPDYTTGYVASRGFGYVRIPNIKHKGSSSGGRVFFTKEGADVTRIVEYLERTPMIVG